MEMASTRGFRQLSWDGDYILLPPKHRFNPLGAFYETVVHERAHWAGIRTGWDHQKQGYAMGELAAEIAA